MTYNLFETPPRCRKPRNVEYEGVFEVRIPNPTPDEAPVAMIVTEKDTEVEYRLFENNLYRRDSVRGEGAVAFGGRWYSAQRDAAGVNTNGAETPDLAQGRFDREHAGHIIIDGEVWALSGEPRYHASTSRLGGRTYAWADVTTYDNPTNNAESYFRADDYAGALAYLVETAPTNTDIKYVHEAIRVLIPEAVTLMTVSPVPDVVRQARLAYSFAADNLSRAIRYQDEKAEAEAFADLTKQRQILAGHGHPIFEPDMRPVEARHV